MIITCKACSTNFNLDDSVLKKEGTKVRCSVCSSIFTAFPPQEDLLSDGLDLPDFDDLPMPSEEAPAQAVAETVPVGMDDLDNGAIVDLDLDENSLGIDDIIEDIIFIPKEPEDLDQETVEPPAPEEPEALAKDDEIPEVTPLPIKEEKDGTGELADLSMPEDDDFNLDQIFSLEDPGDVGELQEEKEEAIAEEPAAELEDLDAAFTIRDEDLEEPEPEPADDALDDELDTGEIPDADEAPGLDEVAPLPEDTDFDLDVPLDIEADLEEEPDTELTPEVGKIEAHEEDALPAPVEPLVEDTEDDAHEGEIDFDIDDVSTETDIEEEVIAYISEDDEDAEDGELELEFTESLTDETDDEFSLEDTSDIDMPDLDSAESVLDTDIQFDQPDDDGPSLFEIGSDFGEGFQEVELDLDDDDEDAIEDGLEFEDGELKLEEDVDNDTLAFADLSDDVDFDAPGEELDLETLDEVEDESIAAPVFEEDAAKETEDDGFEFDTDGELFFEGDEDEESGDEGLLTFEPDDADAGDEGELEVEDDGHMLEFDTGDDEEEEEVFGMEEEGELFLEEMEEGEELPPPEDDGELIALDSETLEEEGESPGFAQAPITAPSDGFEDIDSGFELEFDMDPDLGLSDGGDPDYLEQETLEPDTNGDTLEMLEIDSGDEGEAILEDLSESDDFKEYDEVIEHEEEPEVIMDDDGTIIDGDAQKGDITRPVPPPLTEKHFGKPPKVRRKKSGGSPIVKFFLFIIFLALMFLAAYSASVMTGYKIPYISDLKIPMLDKYLQPPPPPPEPVLVYPTDPSVSARFVANEKAGNLFVITGKVVNDSNIFISHIRVQGSLITESEGTPRTQAAYCGNILSDEQLKKGDLAELNKILGRKTGEKNNNVKIKPRGMVQFMIVFSDLPAMLKNFEVRVAGFDRLPAKNKK